MVDIAGLVERLRAIGMRLSCYAGCESSEVLVPTELMVLADDAAKQAADALEAFRWRTGEPEEGGRYIVFYQQGSRRRVFVADWDQVDRRWLNMWRETTVLAWMPEPPAPEQGD